jgi:hypothetical protein
MKPYLRKKIPSAQTKRGAGGVARGVQLEFKPQHGNKKKKKHPLKACKIVFYIYLTLGGLFFQVLLDSLGKSPQSLPYFLLI